MAECPECAGSGLLSMVVVDANGVTSAIGPIPCPSCEGSGAVPASVLNAIADVKRG